MNVRRAVRRLAERVGFDVTRVQSGRDAGRDIKTYLNDVPRPIVLDVGANAGQSAALFRGLLPDCEIHCFEPAQSVFRELERNTVTMANLHLHQIAVGATTGVRRFLESNDSGMSSFLPAGRENWGVVTDEFEVSVVTLDDFCIEASVKRIDLLKTDTQGYDLEVLRGADRLLSAGSIGLVYTEVTFADLYEGSPEFDELYRFLVDRDMRLVALYNYEMRDDVVAWCDALFASPRSS